MVGLAGAGLINTDWDCCDVTMSRAGYGCGSPSWHDNSAGTEGRKRNTKEELMLSRSASSQALHSKYLH